MKINKSFLYLLPLVIIIVVAGLVTGCSSSSTSVSSTTGTTSTSSATSTGSTATTSASAQAVTIDLTAQNFAFDKSTITVPAGAAVTVNFNNKDSGVPHNLAVYTDSSASTTIFKGQIFTGPDTMTYTFTAPATPGNYFFRCDVHPTQMTGTFVVTSQ